MRPNLQGSPGAYERLDLAPVLAVQLDGTDELLVLLLRPPSLRRLLLVCLLLT